MNQGSNQDVAALNFFGQFMVRRGCITAGELGQALTLMTENNKSLGEWAVESGLLTVEEADKIHFEQRISDFFFGEIAIQKNLLTEYQVQRLLEKQKSNSLRLGEALIELGHMTESATVEALRHFQGRQLDFLDDEEVIGAITEDWLLAYVMEYFPRLVGRVADRQMKLGAPSLWDASLQYDLHATVDIACYSKTAISYDVSVEQVRGIARGMIGSETDDFEDKQLLTTVASELLNFLFIGLERRAEDEEIQSGSEYEILLGLSAKGFAIPTVTPDGLGSIIVRRQEDD